MQNHRIELILSLVYFSNLRTLAHHNPLIMKLVLVFSFITLMFLLFSCKAKENYTPETYKDEMIVFGTSGGFAGHTTSYALLSNGQFFYKAPRFENYASIKSLKKRVTKQIFNNIENLKINDLELDDPGNLTYFMEITGDKHLKKLKWGGFNQKAPETLKIYFTNLMLLAKQQNTVKAEPKTEKS
jgi:hypothetical protein